MKVQVVSDMHLEFADFDLKNAGADVLVLSGDILVAKYFDGKSPDSTSKLFQRFNGFMSRISMEFPHVVYVAGNHEFYGGRWMKTIDLLTQYCSLYSNVHYLERECWTHEDVTFIGSTLWTDMNRGDPLTLHAVRDMMSDYRAIVNDAKGFTSLRPYDTAQRHRLALDYIKSVVAEQHSKKFVVVGHHAPSFASVDEFYKAQHIMNGAYASELSEFILDRPQIKLWTHGHMHDPSDYMIGSTRVVCNPRGYYGHETRANQWTGGEQVIEI